MTPTEKRVTLESIGHLLYGARWIAPLARDLERRGGPTLRTLHRWNKGQGTIMPDVWPLLATIAKSKSENADAAHRVAERMSEREK